MLLKRDFVNRRALALTGLLAFVLFGLQACKKEEGTGGLATIYGKVDTYDVNLAGDKVDSGYLADLRVFISYGDNTWVDDDTRTSYTGEYVFQWLQKGDYTIWVVNDCDGCPDDNKADTVKVHIDKKRETVTPRNLIYLH